MKKLNIIKVLFAASALALALPGCSNLSTAEETTAAVEKEGKIGVRLAVSEAYRTIISTLPSDLTYTLDVLSGTTKLKENIAVSTLTSSDAVVYLEAGTEYTFVLTGKSGDKNIVSGSKTQTITAANSTVGISLSAVTGEAVSVELALTIADMEKYGVKSIEASVFTDDELSNTSTETSDALSYNSEEGKISGTVVSGANKWVKITLKDADGTEIGGTTEQLFAISNAPIAATVEVPVLKYKATINLTTAASSKPSKVVLKNTSISNSVYEGIDITNETESTASPYKYEVYVPVGSYGIYAGDNEDASGTLNSVTEVTANADATLKSISVAWADGTQPVLYTGVSEADLLSKITITETYSDNSTKELAATGASVTDFDSTKTAAQTITLTHNEKTATISVTLTADAIDSITANLSEDTASKTWWNGESLTASDIVVEATWLSGKKTNPEFAIAPETLSAGKNVEVTITETVSAEDARKTAKITLAKVRDYANGTYNLVKLASENTEGATFDFATGQTSLTQGTAFADKSEDDDVEGIWWTGFKANGDWTCADTGAKASLKLNGSKLITITAYAGTKGITVTEENATASFISGAKTVEQSYSFYTENAEPATIEIAFTAGDYVKTIKVEDLPDDLVNEVTAIAISGAEVDDEENLIMDQEDSYTLKAALTTKLLNPISEPVVWSCENKDSTNTVKIAEIDSETGVVTFTKKSKGFVTFTATVGEKSQSIDVNVKEYDPIVALVTWDWTTGGVWYAKEDGTTPAYDSSSTTSYKLEGKAVSGYVVNNKGIKIPVTVGDSSTSAKLAANGERGQFKGTPASLKVPVSAGSVLTVTITGNDKKLKIAGETVTSDSNKKFKAVTALRSGYILIENAGDEVYFASITVTNLNREDSFDVDAAITNTGISVETPITGDDISDLTVNGNSVTSVEAGIWYVNNVKQGDTKSETFDLSSMTGVVEGKRYTVMVVVEKDGISYTKTAYVTYWAE